MHGVRHTRRVFETWRRGALDGAALLRRLRVRCALAPQQTIVLATRDSEKALRREFEARTAAGLDVSWLSPRQVASVLRVEAAGGMRIRDGMALDPYRACLGLAAAGASIIDARIHTTRDGMALDNLLVQDSQRRPYADRRLRARLVKAVNAALSSEAMPAAGPWVEAAEEKGRLPSDSALSASSAGRADGSVTCSSGW